MSRLTAALAITIALTACTSPLTSAPPPSPLPSPTPHNPAASALLQPADLPGPLAPCPGAGPIASYIATMKAANPVVAQRLTRQWNDLQGLGATDAAINTFAADPSACNAELAAVSNVQSAASLVVAFADQGQADRAWQAGILGFTPPLPGERPPGIAQGTATGLGPSSWTYDRTPVRVACWQKNVFVALVVFTNLDATAFKAGTAAVDARLN
ncbi:MAG TPA: hypothetical protein VGV88_06030 [Candidatus Dormibacteraeota bacterium]|nr:hypothetical protein [Candidatus Dormibacteraeota bacterium]